MQLPSRKGLICPNITPKNLFFFSFNADYCINTWRCVASIEQDDVTWVSFSKNGWRPFLKFTCCLFEVSCQKIFCKPPSPTAAGVMAVLNQTFRIFMSQCNSLGVAALFSKKEGGGGGREEERQEEMMYLTAY